MRKLNQTFPADDQVLSARVSSSLPITSDCISVESETGLDDEIPRRILLNANRLALRVNAKARL
jgi:hypothetical protein